MDRTEALEKTKSSKYFQVKIFELFNDDEEFVYENLKIIHNYYMDLTIDEQLEHTEHLEREIKFMSKDLISHTSPRIQKLLNEEENPIKLLEICLLEKQLNKKEITQPPRKAKI